MRHKTVHVKWLTLIIKAMFWDTECHLLLLSLSVQHLVQTRKQPFSGGKQKCSPFHSFYCKPNIFVFLHALFLLYLSCNESNVQSKMFRFTLVEYIIIWSKKVSEKKYTVFFFFFIYLFIYLLLYLRHRCALVWFFITKTHLFKYTEKITTINWKKKSDKNSDIFHMSAQTQIVGTR